MRNPWTLSFFMLCAYYIFLILQYSPPTYGEVEGKDFDYKKGSEKHGGDLHEDWATCNDGIDINKKNVQLNQSIGSLMTSYDSSHATMRKRGNDIMVNWTGGAGPLLINGKSYVLQQSHWHSPSEHTLFGQRYPLELHMVHTSSDGDRAVISIMYHFGRQDLYLFKLMKFIKILQTKDEIHMGLVPPPVIEKGVPYYRYRGSLTTPPCTEGVIWSLIHEVKTVSKRQVNLLRNTARNENNARPMQPNNARTVLLYKPESQEDLINYFERKTICRKFAILKRLLCP